jgi:hypothetical protein
MVPAVIGRLATVVLEDRVVVARVAVDVVVVDAAVVAVVVDLVADLAADASIR